MDDKPSTLKCHALFVFDDDSLEDAKQEKPVTKKQTASFILTCE